MKSNASQILKLLKGGTKEVPNRGGMEDAMTMPIMGANNGGPTGDVAALSEGEYVIPADVVSLIGDGSTEAGAARLDAFVERIRKKKGKHLSKGKQAPPLLKLLGGIK